jgi:hypothetical protein
MRALTAGLIFVNATTVTGLLIGLAGRGLSPLIAGLSILVGLIFAAAAGLATVDPAATVDPPPATQRYARVWFWALAAVFAMFAFRSFCWLIYNQGAELKIQSPNNLGDLALHITYIRSFASGVAFWPDNPIFVASKLRYPAGTDLFNALLALVNVDLIRGLVWVGLLGSLATFYMLWRWGREFAIAGFLFNGGVIGFQLLTDLQFQDYQGAPDITWKSIPLAMFVTQRGWLYAIPAGLLLLWHWREKFYGSGIVGDAVSVSGKPAASPTGNRGPLGFAVELALYASLPLFHVHTFLALSMVLVFLFLGGDANMRRHILLLVGAALIPATFFVWLVSDNFHASGILKWDPGWVLNDPTLARSSWLNFWFVNFGILMPLVLALFAFCAWNTWRSGMKLKLELFAFVGLTTFGLCIWRLWESGWHVSTAFFAICSAALSAWCIWRASDTEFISNEKAPEDLTMLMAAAGIFVFGMLFKVAPWEWDNLKIMIWGYFIALPFLWTHLISKWPEPLRVAVCIALFGSGFVSLFGGLAASREGFGLANRGEVDGVGVAVALIPPEARIAAYPTYNHPLLLQGRKVVMGYPGHLWTQGFDYAKVENALKSLMTGQGDWRKTARGLGVRYLFWGREEKQNYPSSPRPWQATAPIVAAGDWGAIYDLEALEPSAPRTLGSKSPSPGKQ